MSVEMNNLMNHNSNISISEVLFGTLLAIAALGSIWISSTLLIHLYQNMF